jgi:DHA3 family macrolide efflux protein-like MFS transporter
VTRHFGGDALELAWINTSFGVGFVVGGLLLGVWGGFRRKIWTSVLGLFGLGVGALVIGLAPVSAFWLGVAGMAFVGLMNPITNGPFFAIIQAAVAPDLQGRVFTVIGSISAGMAPIGLALAGPVADWLGVRVWYVVGAVACFAIGLVIINVPAMMHLEEGRPSGPSSATNIPAAEQADRSA